MPLKANSYCSLYQQINEFLYQINHKKWGKKNKERKNNKAQVTSDVHTLQPAFEIAATFKIR